MTSLFQGLYCDVKQFLNYIKETKGGTFRRVALSGLLDAVDRTPGKKPKTTKVVRYVKVKVIHSMFTVRNSSCVKNSVHGG